MIDFENRGPLAVSGPALSYQDEYTNSPVSSTSLNTGTINIGSDTDAHHCLVFIHYRPSSGTPTAPTSVEVANQSCTLITSVGGFNTRSAVYITDATITEATGAVTATLSDDTGRSAVAVYDVRGLDSTTPVDTYTYVGSGASMSDTQTTTSGGFVVGFIVTNGAETISWDSGLTEDANVQIGTSGRYMAAASETASGSTLAVTASTSGTTTQTTMLLVSMY